MVSYARHRLNVRAKAPYQVDKVVLQFYNDLNEHMAELTPMKEIGEAPGFLGRLFPSLNFEIPWYVWGGVAVVGLASGAGLAYGLSGRKREQNPDDVLPDTSPIVNPDEAAA